MMDQSNLTPRLVLGAALTLALLALAMPPVQAGLSQAAPEERRAAAAWQSAPLDSAAELIQEVNQLRAANGLPPYQVNRALMAAAQAHSEYQAAIGTVTHTGAGGTRPRDRALAAGYGGGGTVFISENIAGGRGLTPQQAVQWWQGDSLHLNTLLSASYQDVGAGAAEAEGVVYYTLDVGYVANAAAPPPTDTSAGSPAGVSGSPAPAARPVIPVQVATPRADGSIVHIVQTGQALWTIAAAYKVPLAELLALNNLTENSLIYPGDKILIRPAQGTSTPTPSETPTQAPTSTSRPSRTPTLTPQASPGLPSAPTAASSPQPPSPAIDPWLIGIGVLAVLGAGLTLFGTLLKRN